MKEKIKEALKQKYVNLGLGDEVFEGVASSVETLISDESQIPNFVNGAEGMLKKFQSAGDRERTKAAEAIRRAEAAEAKLKELQDDGGDDKDKPAGLTAEALAKAIADALKPVSDELTAIKNASALKDATNAAKDAFFGNDYAKKYVEEATEAWERAQEVNDAMGGTMTADALREKAQGYFAKAVGKKGVDTSKPFEADNDAQIKEGTTDWSSEVARKKEQGLIPSKD